MRVREGETISPAYPAPDAFDRRKQAHVGPGSDMRAAALRQSGRFGSLVRGGHVLSKRAIGSADWRRTPASPAIPVLGRGF